MTLKQFSRKIDSYWFSDVEPLKFPSLQEDLSADILIVGAGITGILTAYCLSKVGKKVTIVDADQIGGGETGCTTAHLTWVLDSGYAELEKFFNADKARLAFESHRSAIDFIEKTIQEEKIDCDFKRVNGYTFLSPDDKKETFEEELKTLHGFGATETSIELKAPFDFFNTGACLRAPNQAQFHPLKFLNGLVQCIQTNGGRFFCGTRISHIESGKAKTEAGHEITANRIIVATHSPIKNILFFLKEAAYRSYVIAGKIGKNEVPAGLYCDTEDPYHYVRTQAVDDKNDLLIIGGEDHKTGQNDDYEAPFNKLESWAKKHFPMFKKTDTVWSGQIIEPVDGLAFIGLSPFHKNIYIATGYSGNGMTYSAIAAMIFRDRLLDKKNEWADLYDPTRKNLKTIKYFLEENLNMVKEMVTGYLESGDIENRKELKPGEGAIIKEGLSHLAVYRDDNGQLYSSSAVCTHLGCVVQWNSAQKTFDCPCHGSRFSGKGEVICGPAIRNLKNVAAEVPQSSGNKILN